MYTIAKKEGKSVLLVSGSPNREEVEAMLKALEMDINQVHFVGANEMAVNAHLQADELKKQVSVIQNLIPKDLITIKQKHREKPHHNKYVRRNAMKSKW
jgi:phosphoribosylanthranilate isomerase